MSIEDRLIQIFSRYDTVCIVDYQGEYIVFSLRYGCVQLPKILVRMYEGTTFRNRHIASELAGGISLAVEKLADFVQENRLQSIISIPEIAKHYQKIINEIYNRIGRLQ